MPISGWVWLVEVLHLPAPLAEVFKSHKLRKCQALCKRAFTSIKASHSLAALFSLFLLRALRHILPNYLI